MENALYHHGVKGMKWGVRKTKNRSELSNNLKPVKKPKMSDMYDSTHKVATDRMRAKYLSNEDLAARNKRLQLEKTYNELRPKSATEKLINASLKIGTQVLTEIGKEYAKSYVSAFANGTIPKPGKNNEGSVKNQDKTKFNASRRDAKIKDPRDAFRRK
mgnify:FL=1|jgi:hypothetical protein|nr:MAG TPA: hypothetical protein [Caudoviricetes sp.]